MKRTVLSISIAAALAAISGCSSFKLGAFCYVPADGGQCAAASVPVISAPQATAATNGV